jgi:hypothetical protein
MRTEAEVEEAIRHMAEAVLSPIAATDPIKTALMYAVQDAFRWVLGQPSQFESAVIEPCRRIDRARRAKSN